MYRCRVRTAVCCCLEVDPFHLLPGYAAGISGRTLPVERVGSDLNTRGDMDPAGNDSTGTWVPGYPRVPGYPGTRGVITRRVHVPAGIEVGPYPFNG